MLKGIPQSRLLSYLMFIGAIPLAFVLFQFWSERAKLQQLENMIEHVETAALTYQRRQAVNMAVVEYYRDADHFYIDKNLETLTFLDPEIDALKLIVSNKNFAGDPKIKERLQQLSQNNKLAFTEGAVQSFPLYQETTETLTHPVEVNTRDIQKVLAKVEGVAVGGFEPVPRRPQLIVLDFKLDKKKLEDENEVYHLHMKLLKREYL